MGVRAIPIFAGGSPASLRRRTWAGGRSSLLSEAVCQCNRGVEPQRLAGARRSCPIPTDNEASPACGFL